MLLESAKVLYNNAGRFMSKNLPTILMSTGIIGMVSGTVLACYETPKAIKLLEERKESLEKDELSKLETVVAVAPAYWKPAAVSFMSIVCIIYANNISLKRQAAALAAYTLSENKLKDYKDAVIKTVGEKKSEEIKDKVAEEAIKNAPQTTPSQPVIFTGGDHLCFDSVSGRYFRSSIEKVKQAVNETNQVLLTDGDVSLNELYYRLGLEEVSLGEYLGWSHRASGEMIDISYSSQLTKEGEPCLVLEYNVQPTYLKYEY